MSKTNSHTTSTTTATQRPHSWANIRRHPDQRQHEDPLNYTHPWPSMAEYAKRLALRTDASRTRHSYYRSMRLIHEHFSCDPAQISQDQLPSPAGLDIGTPAEPPPFTGNSCSEGAESLVKYPTFPWHPITQKQASKHLVPWSTSGYGPACTSVGLVTARMRRTASTCC